MCFQKIFSNRVGWINMEYIKFCFVSNRENFYTTVVKYSDLKKSYKIAKNNIIKRIMNKFGKYDITDVSFKLKNDKWSKIPWAI